MLVEDAGLIVRVVRVGFFPAPGPRANHLRAALAVGYLFDSIRVVIIVLDDDLSVLFTEPPATLIAFHKGFATWNTPLFATTMPTRFALWLAVLACIVNSVTCSAVHSTVRDAELFVTEVAPRAVLTAEVFVAGSTNHFEGAPTGPDSTWNQGQNNLLGDAGRQSSGGDEDARYVPLRLTGSQRRQP